MWHDISTMNKITRAMVGVLLLCVLYAGYKWVALQPMFDLRAVKIQGSNNSPLRYVDVATVRSAALPRIRGNFFTADLATVRSAFEMVPWVQRASVRREWPNKLIVSIDEYRVLGAWGEQDGRLLSVDGYLFTANLGEAEAEGRLPQLVGPDDSAHEVAARLADLRNWLAPLKLAPRELELSKRYAWTAKLNNGITLKLGRIQEREAFKLRVERFVTAYPRLSTQLSSRIETVDMRYPNGLAYRTRGQAAVETPDTPRPDAV
ncbi:MAG: cell division protein FtsQ/DivIB [Oxalobacteraceae bacterium]|jgi:cell division protein FtsQ|nr:cell division protein FtsQ/DivIB [Oxalobacteraceae bacterium]